MSILGLDVGTTGSKAIAFDLEGRAIASSYREYPLLHPNKKIHNQLQARYIQFVKIYPLLKDFSRQMIRSG